MKVYNNTSSSLSLPLNAGTKLEIPGKSVSGNILGSNEFLTTVISNFTTDEIAFIVNGPWELSLCANIPTCTNYVVQSLEEAVERFTQKKEVEPEVKVENKVEDVPCKCSDDDCECDNKEAESCSCDKSSKNSDNKDAEVTEEVKPKKKVVRRRVVSKKAADSED